jgi:hypothetical protein
MTEQSPSAIGTVAQEAARLIEDMATMARFSYSRGDDPSPYAGQRAQEPVWPEASPAAGPAEHHQTGGADATDEPSERTCSMCGAESGGTPGHDTPGHDTTGGDTPSTCKICPLCRGIEMLRSVRPETVDMLADLAMSVAGSLRDMAVWSRASDPTSSARSTPGGPPEPDRAPVQDIPVGDESEG